MGVALSAVLYLLYRGRYCGLGTNLINASLAGEPIYAWDWALKLALTVLTLSAGFQGGEVTPLLQAWARPWRASWACRRPSARRWVTPQCSAPQRTPCSPRPS